MRRTDSAPQPMPSPRRPKKRRAADHPNHERWLVSYADFVTLLFAFFTALYAISNVDAKKLSAMVESTQAAFDPAATGAARSRILEGTKPPPKASKGAVPDAPSGLGLGDLQKKIAERLAKQIAEGLVEIEKDGRGLVISIREAGAFSVGSADLSADAQMLLHDLGSVLSGINNHVSVEGHTDNVPIHTARFASNWELSTARATTVIAFLLEHSDVSPEMVAASGYAQYHPRVPNSSDANRTRNRRVDLIILNSTAAPAAQASTTATR